jgi:hypothetical protein
MAVYVELMMMVLRSNHDWVIFLRTTYLPCIDVVCIRFVKEALYTFICRTADLWTIFHASEFQAANPEVPGSIPGATRFSE